MGVNNVFPDQHNLNINGGGNTPAVLELQGLRPDGRRARRHGKQMPGLEPGN
jgi:hypothetical protein